MYPISITNCVKTRTNFTLYGHSFDGKLSTSLRVVLPHIVPVYINGKYVLKTKKIYIW